MSIEVLANVDAMMLAVDDAAAVQQFGIDEILAIHRRLIERAENRQIAGRIRKSQNWIGGNDYNPCGADFVPPPPEEVKRLLADLCRAINDDILPPLAQAALVHAQFETIHPFDDGNGRTGRALIHVVLRRRGVAPQYLPPVSVILANAKSRYIAALNSFRRSDMADWLAYFAGATTSASRLAEAYVKAVTRLRDRWRQQLADSPRAPRADAAAWQIIDILPAHPVLTGAAAAAASGRSRPQTYQGIEQLVEADILRPISESSRNRAWEATGLLKLIAALEAGRLPGR
jgi:Fic family protein